MLAMVIKKMMMVTVMATLALLMSRYFYAVY